MILGEVECHLLALCAYQINVCMPSAVPRFKLLALGGAELADSKKAKATGGALLVGMQASCTCKYHHPHSAPSEHSRTVNDHFEGQLMIITLNIVIFIWTLSGMYEK